MSRVEKHPNGCWEWTQYLDKDGYGYGRLTVLGGGFLVHRALYQLLVGPVDDSLVIDHLCRNTKCCNPEHLEPVTQAVNIDRGYMEPRKVDAAHSRTHCRNGHAYTPETTRSTKPGERRCRTCVAASSQRSRQRKSAA
ncbi:HNH endonuclease signature motif containing protein [Nocardia sp. NPDC058640]|uniref:HNH endonuclease signature motif containing protein n=1 Tax=Nocardia sp. NPDC058640 TaxID=3346571 RepID=UPI00364D6CF1